MNIRILTRRSRLTGRHLPPVVEWAIVCPVCELDALGYDDEAEASYLAGIHNDLHHGSPDAVVAPVSEPQGSSRRFGGAV
jgi:hypothetical protein